MPVAPSFIHRRLTAASRQRKKRATKLDTDSHFCFRLPVVDRSWSKQHRRLSIQYSLASLKVNIMEFLPLDVLSSIFGYLDAFESLRCRYVCRRWSPISGKDCIYLCLKKRDNWQTIGSIKLVGSKDVMSNDEEDRTNVLLPARLVKRTRGHLPDPIVLVETQRRTSATVPKDALCIAKTNPSGQQHPTFGTAFKLDRDSFPDFRSLHCAAMRCETTGIQEQGAHIPPNKPWLFTKSLVGLDLSGQCHLQRLSVRGCISLRRLCLPSSLVALDAHSCTNLRRISFPQGVTSGGFVALNINGCRSLEKQDESLFGSMTKQAMTNAKDVDMSAVNPRISLALASALRVTTCLETLSLRHVAHDQILLALSESKSARSSLRLLDVAFSSAVTDAVVETLVRNAIHLERLNLRGCHSVSVHCYNETPVVLLNRKRDGTYTDTSFMQRGSNDGAQSKRKGDNIFTLTVADSHPAKRRKVSTI